MSRPFDRLFTDPESPPQDLVAEASVLARLWLKPHVIGQYSEIGDMLHNFWHRRLWQAMVAVHRDGPTLDVPGFWFALQRWLYEHDAANAEVLWFLVNDVCDDMMGWFEKEAARDNALVVEQFRKNTWSFMYGRLQQAAEARRLISLAQTVAERAWRMDVDGARSMAAFIDPRQETHEPETSALDDLMANLT